MSRAADSIRKGLEQAVAYAKGDISPRAYRVHVPAHVDAKAIRTKLGMTQQAFAARFGFSVNTLRHWEQGKREPEGPTRAYLLVIEHAPRVVERALKIACGGSVDSSCCRVKTAASACRFARRPPHLRARGSESTLTVSHRPSSGVVPSHVFCRSW